MTEVLYLTSAGCPPCIETKPQVRAICDQYGASFTEINVRTEGGKQKTLKLGLYGEAIPICVIVKDGVRLKDLKGKTDILTNIENYLTTKQPDKQPTKTKTAKKLALGALALLILSRL